MVLPAFFTAIPAASSQLFGDDAIISITFRTAIIQEMKYLDYYDNPNNYYITTRYSINTQIAK